MIKQELLNIMDDELLDKLFGFCYARTKDSYEAQELCSDIVFALVKAARTDGDIDSPYSFIWKVAHNVYADFLDRERRHAAVFYEGDSDAVFSLIAAPEPEDDSDDLNKRIDLNLILWQQVFEMSYIFSGCVEKIMEEKYFADAGKVDRPFSVYGYVENGKTYGGGWDTVGAENVCGYTKVFLENIYITRIRKHFSCGLNVASDPQIQLALRAVDGLEINGLSEQEKEHAARAIDCGYLYREGEMLYTKILVSDMKDHDRLFALSGKLDDGCFDTEAEKIAEKIANMIHKNVPEYLRAEWRWFNKLANMPVLDNVVEDLIRRDILTPPEDGIGAEGCWVSVAK